METLDPHWLQLQVEVVPHHLGIQLEVVPHQLGIQLLQGGLYLVDEDSD